MRSISNTFLGINSTKLSTNRNYFGDLARAWCADPPAADGAEAGVSWLAPRVRLPLSSVPMGV